MVKAKGEGDVASEIIKSLGPIGKERLLMVLNEIYETGELPPDI